MLPSKPPPDRFSARPRTAADGCERLTTVANATTTSREQGSIPPELNKNPSLRIREKTVRKKDHEIRGVDHGTSKTPVSLLGIV